METIVAYLIGGLLVVIGVAFVGTAAVALCSAMWELAKSCVGND